MKRRLIKPLNDSNHYENMGGEAKAKLSSERSASENEAAAPGQSGSPTATLLVSSAKRENTAEVPETRPASELEPGPVEDKSRTTMEILPSLLEEIGSQIATAHAAAQGGFVEVLLSAAKCGLLLMAAKDAVKPGQFEAWFDQTNFGFTKMTRCKYMRLAERLCEEAKSKPGLLLSIDRGTDRLPTTFTFDEVRLRTVVATVSDGRSLSQLYADWDIIKRTQSKNGKSTHHSTQQPESPQEVFGRWSGIVEEMPKLFSQLARDQQERLVSQLERLLLQLKQFGGN